MPTAGLLLLLSAAPADIAWWSEARFGVFMCWGPCSLADAEIGWSRWGPRPGMAPAGGGVPLEVYDNLYRRFSATEFDARAWARLIRESGAGYVIWLTKHHDGFCLFDSALTDYDIMTTPLGRDVTRELADALRAEGLRIVWYYSQPDWHHPDYRTERHDRYVEYLHGQIRELLTQYGRIDGLWFDGLGGRAGDWDAERLCDMARELQPGILINDRCGLAGDFDTPEQEIGAFQLGRPWESCITMSSGWSWGGVRSPVKSLTECLHLLIRCAGGGGNLALDTGPMPDGRIDPRQAHNYLGMGRWLDQYGATIRGTTGGPWTPGEWGAATRRDRTIWLHVLDWPGDTLTLPALPVPVAGSRCVTGGRPVVTQDEEHLTVTLPAMHHDPIDTIIELELADSAMNLPAMSTLYPGSLSLGRPATASSEWDAGYAAALAFDGIDSTRWGGAPDSRSGWLEVDLGEERTVGRILVREESWNRVQRHAWQVLDGDEWRTFRDGTTLGNTEFTVEPVRGRRFRLLILESSEVPTIWEVQLFGPTEG